MATYPTFLTEVISSGETHFALTNLRTSISDFKTQAAADEGIDDLNMQVVMLSSRLQEVEKRESMSTISNEDAHIERSSITYALLALINSLDQHPAFLAWANTQPHTPPQKTMPNPLAASTRPKQAAPASGDSKWKWLTIGGLSIFVLIMIIGSLSDPTPSDNNNETGQHAAETAGTTPAEIGGGNQVISSATTTDLNLLPYLAHTWVGTATELVGNTAEAQEYCNQYGASIASYTFDMHKDGTMDVYIGNQHQAGYWGLENGLLSMDEGDSHVYTYTIERVDNNTLVLIDGAGFCRWIFKAA